MRIKETGKELIYGKVPPQARDLEVAVLGAIMLDKQAITIATEILKPECFYVEQHNIIFSAMCEMYKNGEAIDNMTVVYKLKDLGQLNETLNPYFITTLTNSVVTGAHVEAHCRIIIEKHIQREIIRMASELIAEAYEDGADVFDLAAKVDTVGGNIQNALFKRDYTHIEESVLELANRIEYLKTQPNSITGVTTGFPTLDHYTHGWQNSDLIILAARPSVGKTAFSLNLAKNAAVKFKDEWENGGRKGKCKSVGFFSLEMPKIQLTQRIVSNVGGIFMDNLATGKDINEHFYNRALSAVNELPIYIDDTPSLNLFEFKAKARRMVTKHNVGLIVIDYLQLMSGVDKRGGNREQEISSISRGLKGAAKEMNIPIIALSQLSRKIEDRTEAKPKLSDLRESGSIEQDADVVGFLFWSEYQGVKKGTLKLAKHRNGKTIEEDFFNVHNHFQRWEEIGVPEFEEIPSNFIPISKQEEKEPF